jgi:CBS-domain-containing membrane protein
MTMPFLAFFATRAAPRRHVISVFLGSFLCILSLEWLTQYSHTPWIMAPFGASCVLAFALPESPLAQPRHIIGGHLLSSAVGLMILHFCGDGLYCTALAVALAISLMLLLRLMHPPAGADPLLIMSLHATWSFLLQPVLLGSLWIVLLAYCCHRLISHKRYPTSWR